MTIEREPTVGRNVAALLRRFGVTQREMAGELGMTPAMLSRRISGQVRWQQDELPKIARILEVSMDTFYEGVSLDESDSRSVTA